MNARIRSLPTYPMAELAARKRELAARGIEVFDFGTGDPIEPTAARIRDAFAAGLPTVSQYPRVEGSVELRGAFARWFGVRFGVTLDPEREVLPTRGSKEAMFHAPLVLVDPSEARRLVVYPTPGYPVMEIGSLYAGAELRPVRLTRANDYLMDPRRLGADELARACVVWLNYPHNPTGRDLPAELFEAWVAARDEHGFVLCSDECYTELWFGERPRSLLEFGGEGCLAFHSLSKRSGMTGYRSGIVAGDPSLVELYRRCRSSMGQAMPAATQAASVAAWSDEAHVEERRRFFGAKRALMCSGLGALGLAVYPSSSTFYLWVDAPAGETGASYAERLLELGIVVSPGSFFGEGNEAHFRVALVPSAGDCERALNRWKKIA